MDKASKMFTNVSKENKRSVKFEMLGNLKNS